MTHTHILVTYLCKLWLSICSHILISIATSKLEVAIKPSNHQQLLKLRIDRVSVIIIIQITQVLPVEGFGPESRTFLIS